MAKRIVNIEYYVGRNCLLACGLSDIIMEEENRTTPIKKDQVLGILGNRCNPQANLPYLEHFGGGCQVCQVLG